MNFFCLQIKKVFFFALFLLPSLSFAQIINNSNNGVNSNGSNQATAIQTAVPFLLITPDSRSGAMGEAGVALSPDANSTFWNPAKLAFIEAPDNISVNYKIVEGNKERIQSFKGDVIKRQGNGFTASFTVRKVSDGVGVERTFPIFSPNIESIELNKAGRVRRAKLYFLRERSGKSARIKEKKRATIQ